jgi:hypothetical protein
VSEWVVRPVTGQATTKAYLCPSCSQEIAVGQSHVVVWPVDSVAGAVLGGDHELRRHWHSSCWRRRG